MKVKVHFSDGQTHVYEIADVGVSLSNTVLELIQCVQCIEDEMIIDRHDLHYTSIELIRE